MRFQLQVVGVVVTLLGSCSESSFSDRGAKDTEPANGIDAAKQETAGPIERTRHENHDPAEVQTNDGDFAPVDQTPIVDENEPPIFTSKPITKIKAGELLGELKSVDLTKWTGTPFGTNCDSGTNPPWSFNGVEAGTNMDPNDWHDEATSFVSDFKLDRQRITGTFATEYTDNDYIGFVFGFQSIGKTYVFDWSQGDGAGVGMCLFAIEKPVGGCDLFKHRNVRTISCKSNAGYVTGKRYRYELDHAKGDIRIRIFSGDVLLHSIDSNDAAIGPGKFGFYVSSQMRGRFGIPKVANVQGKEYRYQATAKDPENSSISFTLVQGPDGMSIDKQTGLLIWPTEKQEQGEHEIVIQATDEDGADTKQEFSVTI
jgi:hypothetical protein